MSKNLFVFSDHLVTGRAFFKLKVRIARIIDRGYYEVSCSQKAHAHYGDKFIRADACLYFIHGALSEIFSKI
ncbi:TPA: hypothetical protein KEV01_003852 [Citrobacter koseri]|nr:hypothetical protein [Citrobacter koseri]